jgi:hypothetical protein
VGVVLASTLALASACRGAPEAQDGAVLLESPGPGPCPHPLFPVVVGARWTYELTSATSGKRTRAEITVLRVTKGEDGQVAEIRRTVGTLTTKVTASCNAEGASFLGLFVPLVPPVPAAVNVSPRIVAEKGPMLPPMGSLRAGTEWVHDLTVRSEIAVPQLLRMESVWEVRGKSLGAGEVRVAAGRYQVSKVRLEVAVHHRPPERDDVVLDDRTMDPPSMTFTYSLAEGVGVVLIEGEPLAERPNVRARWELVAVGRSR